MGVGGSSGKAEEEVSTLIQLEDKVDNAPTIWAMLLAELVDLLA